MKAMKSGRGCRVYAKHDCASDRPDRIHHLGLRPILSIEFEWISIRVGAVPGPSLGKRGLSVRNVRFWNISSRQAQ